MSRPRDFIDRLDLYNAATAPGVRRHLRAQCEGVAPVTAAGTPERLREMLAGARDGERVMQARVLAFEAVHAWRGDGRRLS